MGVFAVVAVVAISQTTCVSAGNPSAPRALGPVTATDPLNVPSSAWPADSADGSNSAWPTGRQPASLEAWPKVAGQSTLAPCWKTTVIEDAALGWSGQCVGLQRSSGTSLEICQNTCFLDPLCAVWQFSSFGCWQGQGEQCDSRGGTGLIPVSGAQRIAHGAVRVMKHLLGIQVENLRNLGIWQGGNTQDGVEHCKRYCYSDLRCQYWAYGMNGCWVEDPTFKSVQYPLTSKGGATRTSAVAATIIAGEFIQHYCPPSDAKDIPLGTLRVLVSTTAAPATSPPPVSSTDQVRTAQHVVFTSTSTVAPAPSRFRTTKIDWWAYEPYIVASVLVLLLALCLCCFLLDFEKCKPKGKEKLASSKTRRRSKQEEEDTEDYVVQHAYPVQQRAPPQSVQFAQPAGPHMQTQMSMTRPLTYAVQPAMPQGGMYLPVPGRLR